MQLGEFYAAFVLKEIKNLLAVPQTYIKGKLTNISNWKVEKALVKKSVFVELKVNEVVMEANKAVIYLWLGSLLEWIGADPETPAETLIIKKGTSLLCSWSLCPYGIYTPLSIWIL